jgi:pimeloyl-ACP methyl ester carboxylesterase
MSKSNHFLLAVLMTCALSLGGLSVARSQASSPEVLIINQNSVPLDHLTDGDVVRLRLILPEDVEQSTPVSFSLAGLDDVLAECTIERGNDRCQTELFAALGWRWNPGGTAINQRTVEARSGGSLLASSAALPVAARPVVMVHGFSSNWQAWERYLGPDGYLASIGVPAYAVGDGQFEGVMNTGRIDQPTGRTNTIAENAAILSEYIEAVKKHTGAQKVDLLGHSMGGLISRYYIDRLMGEEGVGQLIMLGSPMAGSDCADLPSALGYYLPAVLEIRPSYIVEVFNTQITHRRGVPFYALAGVPIIEAIKSPCTPVPSDLAVSLESVQAIPLHLTEMPVLHIDLNTSHQVFEEYVRPLLQTPAGGFTYELDPQLTPARLEQRQFTRTYSGRLAPQASQDLTIYIDPDVAVASFALFDPTRSLDVVVRGASGNVIELDPVKNGLTVIDDPEMLFQLGYGFNNPKPGAWQVTLNSTERTPASGADYALTASFVGGAKLQALASPILPQVGQAVQITGRLDKGGQPLEISSSEAVIRLTDGSEETVPLSASGESVQASWTPSQPGLYGVEVRLTGLTPDGSTVDRAASFTIEAQPTPRSPLLGWAILCVIFVAILAINLWVFTILIKRNRKNKQPGAM